MIATAIFSLGVIACWVDLPRNTDTRDQVVTWFMLIACAVMATLTAIGYVS